MKDKMHKSIPIESLRYVMEEYDNGVTFTFKKPIKVKNGDVEYTLKEFVVFTPTTIVFKDVFYKYGNDPGVKIASMVTVENKFLMDTINKYEFEQVIQDEC